MRGDEAQPENESSAPRARTGPRHAAPRRSLLTRAPVGKAIALAAMPTAVLMGMGLTPRLAQADELPKNPFSGDHCVSQSDSPSPDSSPSASPSATPSPSASASATPKAGAYKSSQPAASPTHSATTQAAKSDSASQPAASPSPPATPSQNPWDPLGVGSTLKGLLGGGTGSGSTPTPTASPTPSATPTPSSSPTAGGPAGSASGAVQGATGAVKSTVDNAANAAKSAAASPSASPSTAPSPSSTGAQPFPCPTYNAKALADAGLEQTPSLLPNQPWILKTDLLTLMGLDYKGIVKVKTENGTVKDVLKFTASGVDIKNLHQITEASLGAHYNVQARDGSTSTIRNGTVTMYTEKISGNLFGLIPVTFSPQTPPPINVPLAIFSDCTVTQAGQFGGTLTIPGMHVYRS